MGDNSNRIGRREFLHIAGSTAVGLMVPAFFNVYGRATSKTSLIYDEIYLKHKTGEFHPENPRRLEAIMSELKESQLLPILQPITPRAANLEWIELVHPREYIEIVRRDVLSGAKRLSTRSGNTALCSDSFDVALWSVGGLLSACDAVMAGTVRNAFCAVRPPGHHASAKRGMGFCLFNNVAIAARYLQQKHKLNKVLIVDWDVHHGNGTQDTFYQDGSVFYFSTHQWPWYPWSGSTEEIGEGKGKGATLNAPLPAGSGDKDLINAFEQRFLPLADKFKPDFIIISAGFDSRHSDPLGRFRVTDDGYRKLTQILLQLAQDHAQGRLISALEGGYNPEGIAKAIGAHVDELIKAGR
jgi:acetoin utilization deacetylase AcuC-like enzyme